MNHFNQGFLPPNEKPTTSHPPSFPPELAPFDMEYIKYCIEQEQTVSDMERRLHESDDPQEIGMMALRTACDFYDADWAGIIKVDLELGIATHGWWHNPDPKVNTLQRMYEYENFYPMKTWIESIRSGKPIIIEDVKETMKSSPEEYRVYERLNIKSLLAVPFGPNPLGFLVVRNPTRYMPRTSTLTTLAYVAHRAIAQRNDMERTKMAMSPDEIETDKDIIINFFGDLEIYTQDGVWKESDFPSPRCNRAVAYIMLQNKSHHSALAIADALASEDTADVETINKNVRGYLYRFKKSFGLICKHKLIEYTPNGYRINPSLNIKTDLQQFTNLWELTRRDIPIPQKVHALKHAIKLYRGSVFESACYDHWLVGIATDYKMKYISMVNELLAVFAQFDDYGGIQHYAAKAISLVPENVKARYWLIYAFYHSGAVAIAQQEYEQAKNHLTWEEFDTLKHYLSKDESLHRGLIFVA